MERVRKIGNFVLIVRRIRDLILRHDLLSSGQLFRGDLLRGTRCQFAGQHRLRPEEVMDVLLGERGDDEAAPRDLNHETLVAQGEQTFANRRIAHPDRLSDAVHPQKVTWTYFPGNDELANVTGDLVRQ